jgi:hypothetical protein
MNVFNLPRLAKLSVKTWLKPSYEFSKFVTVCIWACGVEMYTDSFVILRGRILKLIKRGGLSFTYHYLKEVLRLTVRYLAGQGEPNSFLIGRVMVKTDARGLPTIIPYELREVIAFNRLFLTVTEGPILAYNGLIVCILTVISIFRVFNVFPKPSLKTVVAPFNGVGMSLPLEELSQAVQLLIPNVHLKMNRPKLLVLETANPNCSKSTWGASLDAATFLFYPSVFVRLFIYNLHLPSG